MERVKFSSLRRFFRGRGFAAALVLSIGAVGTSAYVAYNSAIAKLGETNNDDFTHSAIVVENPQTGIPRDNVDDSLDVNNPFLPSTTAETQPAEEANADEPDNAEDAGNFLRTNTPKLMPVEGEIINPFSNGELVKSNTLGVWRTHDAVDIAAPLGTEVRAMQKGTVSEVSANTMWGVTITIEHSDGVYSSYMGLDKDVKVTMGQAVEAGDVIALVGNTAEAEIADPPGLHFAVKKNDIWVDPIAYIEGNA